MNDYVKRYVDDVNVVIETYEMDVDLSDDEVYEIAEMVIDKFDWSEYNDFVADMVKRYVANRKGE